MFYKWCACFFHGEKDSPGSGSDSLTLGFFFAETDKGECLLMSSLPGKALRTLADIVRLAKRFNTGSQN